MAGTVVLSKRGQGYITGAAKLYNSSGSPLSESEIATLTCPLCKLILREPKQLITCGCRFCTGCVEQLTSKGPATCVVDGAEFTMNDVRRDRGCQRELESLEVSCPTQPIPCEWRGKLTTVEDHYMECKVAPGECEFCHQIVTRSKMSQHHDMCSKYQVACPCNGCSFKSGKQEMNQHLMISHLLQIVQDNSKRHDEIAAMKLENQSLRVEVSNLTLQLNEVLQSDERKEKQITDLKKQVEELLNERKYSQREDIDFVETDSVGKVRTDSDERKTSGATRGGGAPTLSVIVESNGREEVKSQIQRISASILEMQDTITQHGTAIDDIRLRQDILDVKTTNGVLIWKIPDVRRRYREAVDRKTISLYSPPFYTSPHGYRVCVRVYLNGDGIGKGTHISLFFFIMRSEQDNLLSWPFKQRVRFTLVHQKKSSLSITEAFVPDHNSPSFQKPEQDLNIASGFPKFARQSVLQDEGFTQDNVIYIRCQVDLSGLTTV